MWIYFRADSQTTNSVIILKGRSSLQKKPKPRCFSASVLTELTAMQSGGAQAAQHWQHSAAQAEHSPQATFLWRIHLCVFLGWVYSECCSVNPLPSKWNSDGFALHYYCLDFFLECCPQNSWALQQQRGFVDIPVWQTISENSDVINMPCWAEGKAGGLLKNVWVFPGNWWEPGMCSVCFLLPVERELHATKWKRVLFIVFHWIGLLKDFKMVSKAYILWFNMSWSSNLEYFYLISWRCNSGQDRPSSIIKPDCKAFGFLPGLTWLR